MSRLGDLLIKRSLITPDQLVAAMADAQQAGTALVPSLVKLGLVKEEDLVTHLHREYRFPIIDPRTVEPTQDALQLIPGTLARKHQVLPTMREGSMLTLAVADPSNMVALSEIKFMSGCNIKVVLAPSGALTKAIDRHYGQKAAITDALSELEIAQPSDVATEDMDVNELARATEDAPLVKLVNAIMADAIHKRASDIHIEPYEKDVRVRFRIDGVLYDIMQPPTRFKSALSSRIKIMATLDISERRLPQDGAIKIRLANQKEMSFRVSVMPTAFGEKIVLRLMSKTNIQMDLAKLGFEAGALQHIRTALLKPHGMILVTGPTGSGKSTTLYSALSELNQSSRNISTAEDPVELNIRGVNQMQISEGIGLTFAAALRTFLRQDPDVIMVGEIRDIETAEISVKAALTGHLVLSTLHTNDAPSTISRLLNMGVEPFLVASSLNLIVAQRLVRVICPYCRGPAEHHSKEALLDVGFKREDLSGLALFKGHGCDECANTGFRGRIAIYESLPMTDELRDMVVNRSNATAFKRAAIEEGMQTLRQAGLLKVREGLTTVEEVLRVTTGD